MKSNKGEYYVYVLQDSTKRLFTKDKYGLEYKPFYVGKGKGNRAEIHNHNAFQNNFSHNLKLLNEIQKIKIKGGKVIVSKVYRNDEEDLVYKQESEMIHHYGLRHKDGILVNSGTGKAGGWGGSMNPTYDRMQLGTHNFLKNNPQVESPKVRKLTKMIKEVDTEVDINKLNWVTRSGYSDTRSLRLGIERIIRRNNLPYKLIGNNLKKVR